MCGIAGFIVKDPLSHVNRESLLDELLRGIDHRGGDATGFVARNREGMQEWQKASCDVDAFLPYRRRLPLDVDVCLAHTRYATQGSKAFPENNHPVKRGPMFVTHNGVLWNDRELFAQCERTPYGQVDSEAIAAVLAHAGTLGKPAHAAFQGIDGSAAIAAMDERDGTVLLARISDNPLFVLETRRVILWASTEKAVRNAHTRAIGSIGRAKVTGYRDGEGMLIREGKGTRITFATPPVRAYLAKADKPVAKETTGSYLPTRAQTPPNGRCDICNEPVMDSWDLWDAGDVYDVCEPCWTAYADPRDANLRYL